MFAGELITNIIIPRQKKLTIGKHCYLRYYVQCGTRARPFAHLVYNLFSKQNIYSNCFARNATRFIACGVRRLLHARYRGKVFALNSFPRCSHTELFEHEFSERNLIVPVGCASPGPFPRRLRRFQQQNKQSGSLKLAVFTERR